MSERRVMETVLSALVATGDPGGVGEILAETMRKDPRGERPRRLPEGLDLRKERLDCAVDGGRAEAALAHLGLMRRGSQGRTYASDEDFVYTGRLNTGWEAASFPWPYRKVGPLADARFVEQQSRLLDALAADVGALVGGTRQAVPCFMSVKGSHADNVTAWLWATRSIAPEGPVSLGADIVSDATMRGAAFDRATFLCGALGYGPGPANRKPEEPRPAVRILVACLLRRAAVVGSVLYGDDVPPFPASFAEDTCAVLPPATRGAS
jgi:hypothetical protein